jgi:hypothetical protein
MLGLLFDGLWFRIVASLKWGLVNHKSLEWCGFIGTILHTIILIYSRE